MPPKRPDDFAEWAPVCKAAVETIPAGAKATFTFEPDDDGMWVRTVAASKFAGLTYEVRVDSNPVYGPAGVPPTDVDDLATTHEPPLPVDSDLELIVRNPSSTERDVAAQIMGAEG